MDHRYKEALEGLARLSDAATPGDWQWFGDQTVPQSEEAFVEWSRALYRNTQHNAGVMHFVGADTADGNKAIVSSTGFGPHAGANACFILAATMYVRGIIEIARERGDIAPASAPLQKEIVDG